MAIFRKIRLLLPLVLVSILTDVQHIAGRWDGVLQVEGTTLRVVFHIAAADSGYVATADSPDQGVTGFPVSGVSVEGRDLSLEIRPWQFTYEGVLKNDSLLSGTVSQRGVSFPLDLHRSKDSVARLIRPQEPKPPFSYYSEDIVFRNDAAHITLAGTLTLPSKEGCFPAVVLISGSGAQNRDEELFGHKPFLVLADYLTRNGIAVLRYDDRGTAKSGGTFKGSTTVDFASDAIAAVKYLQVRKEVDPKAIGLIGHSEGGLIAPLIASQNRDIDFIIMLAGPGMRGDSLLLLQQQLIGKSRGLTQSQIDAIRAVNARAFSIITTSKDSLQMERELAALRHKEGLNDALVEMIKTPWSRYFLQHDPAPVLKKVRCPVLALNGTKDLQVPSGENLPLIRQALQSGGNPHFVIKALPGLNHLFQECQTGALSEYGTIEQTFSPKALDEIGKWIKQQLD